jgi:lipopolysaccharide transport system ATP-binding protein
MSVIQVRDLSKRFIIQHEKSGVGKYTALRDVISDKVKGFGKQKEVVLNEEFWALKDINFDVQQGDRLGIIGRNGAGKSTLLKILSRITEPTSGSVKIRGRVASLLEVGTGFHQELTGRENIFLNGAILGMTRSEVRNKFDEIVTFAEVEKFLDTPVKRYSSGMYVRLAFAVAAHLEPEILIVDEVLAVGDAQFQRKCLGKMEDVSKGDGRTVLFVSHSMTSIQALCTKALYMDKGKATGIEPTHIAVSKYLYGTESVESTSEYVCDTRKSRSSGAFIHKIQILNEDGKLQNRFKTTEPIMIRMIWENAEGVACTPNIQLKVEQGGVTALIATDSNIDWSGAKKKVKGVYSSDFTIPAHWLNGNDYFLSVALDSHSPRINFENHVDVIRISIWDPMDETSLARGMFTSVREDAVLWPVLKCSFSKIE